MHPTTHPIIFLWSHPRSMSTAIERIMRQRGDLHCLHEPFLRYYYLHRSDKPLKHFDSGGNQPTSYDATRDMILDLAQKRPVFAKDMSYYVMPELLKDIDFFARIKHCFLIRHPLRALLSYYKLDPSVSLQEIGLESQWLHYQKAEQWSLQPVVIEAEAVQADPQKTMAAFWSTLGLDYKDQAFVWDNDKTPADWDYVKGWHKKVSQSSAIRTETDAQKIMAQQEFTALAVQQPHLKDYLEYHLPAYHALQERA